jgi:hypothetical protein
VCEGKPECEMIKNKTKSATISVIVPRCTCWRQWGVPFAAVEEEGAQQRALFTTTSQCTNEGCATTSRRAVGHRFGHIVLFHCSVHNHIAVYKRGLHAPHTFKISRGSERQRRWLNVPEQRVGANVELIEKHLERKRVKLGGVREDGVRAYGSVQGRRGPGGRDTGASAE